MADFDFTQLKGRMAQAGKGGHVELSDMERNALIDNAMNGGGGSVDPEEVQELIDESLEGYYNKFEVDSELNTKSDKSDTYTKTEVNNLIPSVDNDIIIGTLPSSGVPNTIYRVPGTNSYTDYAWDGTQFVALGTFTGNGDIDNYPIVNSQNAVKGGGLFEELNIGNNLLLSSYPSVRAFINNLDKWIVTDNNYPYYGKFIPCNAGDVYTIKANAEYTSSYAFLRDNTYAQSTTPNYATGSGKVSINAGNEITATAPIDANYIWVCDYTTHSNLPQSISISQSIKDIVESMGDVTKVGQMSQYGLESGIIGIDPIEIYPQKGILNDGTMFATSSTTAQTNKFEVLPNTKYLVSGSCPSDTNLNRMGFVCTDENGGVLDYCKPTANAPFSNFVLTTKSLCKYIYIFGSESSVIKLSRYPLNFNTIKIESIPQIYDTYKDHIETRTSIKILCFGSSWFMNTWWYLNKLIGSINGISCEIHSYYMAHAKMNEWIKFYNNDLTPFTNEPSRGASKNISSNGADWSITNYSSSGSYNAQAYRNDFYADITAGDWDIIAFQQGAQEAIIAEEWEAKEQLVSIIRSHCSIATKIAFNATWTPALKNYSGNYFPTISRSAYGKIYFQQLNTQNTKSFIADTGIDKISPNGALMSLMRADATLNTGTKDMADDGLHPNNGLPMLGLCSCFYETFVAPLINVSIDDITWIPTSSTQKASVSGTSFNSVSATQFSTIKAHIKKALSDRFIYYQ